MTYFFFNLKEFIGRLSPRTVLSKLSSKKRKNIEERPFKLLFFVIVLSAITTFLQLGRVNTVKETHVKTFQMPERERQVICRLVLVCGHGDVDTVSELRALIVSAVLLSSCPLHFILVSDEGNAKRATEMFKTLKTMKKPVSVDIWTISIRFITKWATKFKFSPRGHLPSKRVWLIAKVYLPFLLHQFDRIIVIDTDMIFLDDPATLWNEFNTSGSQNWAYKMPLSDLSSQNTICSCVVLINVQNVIKHSLYPRQFQAALEQDCKAYNTSSGLYQTERVDQAVYFYLRRIHPGLFKSLDRRFNIDHCHRYYNRLAPDSNELVTLLHYNCAEYRFKYHRQGNELFHFFQTYHWEWLKGGGARSYPIRIQQFRDNEQEAMKRFNLSD